MSKDEVPEDEKPEYEMTEGEEIKDEKLEKEKSPFHLEVLEQITVLVSASFAFIAAFAWHETFKHLILPPPGTIHHPSVLVGYSLGITILAVIMTIVFGRATGRAKKRRENRIRSQRATK